MAKITDKLKGGDFRSTGRSDEVVKEVLKNPALFKELFEGILSDDPLVRMRCADAAEKISSLHHEWLQPFKPLLINKVAKIEQQEVRWHTAQMFSYIKINNQERDKITQILLGWIKTEKSSIVKTFAMQTLADFAERDKSLRPKTIKLIEEMMKTGSGAIKARGRKLLVKLKTQ